MRILTKSQMIEAEKQSPDYGVSLAQLMDNAGYGLFEVIKEYAYKNHKTDCLLIIGSGNNGGDGLVAANHLKNAGISPTVLLTSDIKTELAKNAFLRLDHDVRVLHLTDKDISDAVLKSSIIVDCVFGTGFHGEFNDDIKNLFTIVSQASAYKIACDLPSGVNCENGFVAEGTVKYDKTVCFHAVKLGCLLSPAKEYCGEIEVREIGVPNGILPLFETIAFDRDAAHAALPPRPDNAHKGTFGRLTIIAGSEKYPGAACLCTRAALRSGVGIVNVATIEQNAVHMAPVIPEATYHSLKASRDGSISSKNIPELLKEADNSDAVLIGCGLSKTPDTIEIVSELVKSSKGTLIIDADGINCLCENIDVLKNTKATVILTPHPGELSRLVNKSLGTTLETRINSVIDFCTEYGVTVISKSRESFVFDGKKAYLICSGNSALSKGGSGDMLAGIIASLSAQGICPTDACALGSFILGSCAEELSKTMSRRAIIASDIINALPGVLFSLEK